MFERYRCKNYIIKTQSTIYNPKKQSSICVQYSSKSVYFQEENKYEISMDSGTEWKAFYPNQVNDLSHYRADNGAVWAVCSRMIRLHTTQHSWISFRMVPMSAMGFCFHVRDVRELSGTFFLAWTAYSNYLRMINSTKGIKDECFAIRGTCKYLLTVN